MEVTFSGAPTRAIAIDEQSQVGQARREAQQAASALGFDDTDAGRAALVATELATNIIKHGRGGCLYLNKVAGRDRIGLELCAIDRGPGFVLADGLRDGFSTQGTRGIGLGGIQRQTQWLDAWSDDKGAVVVARLYPGASTSADLAYGGWRLPLHGEPVCGDDWMIAWNAQAILAVMIDGLGHGMAAADAAGAGVAAAAAHPHAAPASLLATLHAAMNGSRGGAVAVARYAHQSAQLHFAGTGNISGSLAGGERSRGLASYPGIVGVGMPIRARNDLLFPDSAGKLLVLHSDGLQARWSLQDYPGLAMRHPALIAAVLVRDYHRVRDDASLLIVRLESPT